ncbi:hypothetical protein DND67_07985 [Pseudomonas syringae pv. pisi]|nr:hypothetical protein DND67_07985 [Pseudomonas syringae pv. pisi]
MIRSMRFLSVYPLVVLATLQLIQIRRLIKSAKTLKVQCKRVIAGINLQIFLYRLHPVAVQLQYPA